MPARPPGTLALLLRPSMFLLHVPAVAAVVLAVLLGQWQVEAWQTHRQDRTAELADAEPRPLSDVMGPDDPFPADAVGRPVVVAGSWVRGSTVYVDQRPQGPGTDSADGVWTVSLLATCGTTATGCEAPAAVPVVRGWSKAPERALPEPEGSASVTGWLQPGEGPGDPDPDPGDDVVPSLRVADLLQRADQDLYGGYLILRTPEAARSGLEPVTPASLPKAPTFTALRNLLYGVEWWLFAAFAVFLWWRWTRDQVVAARARIPSGDELDEERGDQQPGQDADGVPGDGDGGRGAAGGAVPGRAAAALGAPAEPGVVPRRQ